jgi:hypothetical protein
MLQRPERGGQGNDEGGGLVDLGGGERTAVLPLLGQKGESTTLAHRRHGACGKLRATEKCCVLTKPVMFWQANCDGNNAT